MTPEWEAAAQRLIDLGYTKKATNNPIVPFTFHARGKETVYLISPLTEGQGRHRSWSPRSTKEAPDVFGVSDVAEHFGISVAHVKHEIYRSKRLKVSQRLGKRGTVLITPEDLAAWALTRPKLGRRPGPRKRAAATLDMMTTERLRSLLGEAVYGSEVTRKQLAEAVRAAGGNAEGDVLSQISLLKRGAIVKLLTKEEA